MKVCSTGGLLADAARARGERPNGVDRRISIGCCAVDEGRTMLKG